MKTTPTILTIDIGTTNCKTCIFNTEGKLLNRTSSNYPTINHKWGGAEQDPMDWWRSIVNCVQNLLHLKTTETYEIIGISITGHMHGIVALDNQGDLLTKCWTLLDQRSKKEAIEINDWIGTDVIYEKTGARIEPYTPIAKILWLKKNYPEIFTKTRTFLSVKDYIRVILGGKMATDPTDAAGMLFYNLKNSCWDNDLIQAIGIKTSQLPEIKFPWSSGGKLSEQAASQLGLKPGIPIVIGSGDDVEVLGGGVRDVGQAFEHIGTTGSMLICSKDIITDPNRNLEIYPHVLPNYYLIGSSTNAAGYSLDWTNQLFGSINQIKIDTLQLDYPPLEDIYPPYFLPFIKGERGILWNDSASGAFIGLRSYHKKEDFFFAVYEGIAFSLNEILKSIESIGLFATEVICSSPLIPNNWATMRSDIYGVPLICPPTNEPTGLGAAILALVHTGVFKEIRDGIEKCCASGERIIPSEENSKFFNQRFNSYRKIINKLSSIFELIDQPESRFS